MPFYIAKSLYPREHL
jgi:hypothetical protein